MHTCQYLSNEMYELQLNVLICSPLDACANNETELASNETYTGTSDGMPVTTEDTGQTNVPPTTMDTTSSVPSNHSLVPAVTAGQTTFGTDDPNSTQSIPIPSTVVLPVITEGGTRITTGPTPKPADPCWFLPCHNEGTCFQDNTLERGYVCSCTNLYRGVTCQIST